MSRNFFNFQNISSVSVDLKKNLKDFDFFTLLDKHFF